MKRKINIFIIMLIVTIISFNYKYTFASNTSRLAGDNRYETSKAISSQFNQADTAILVTGENYPDALSATPLAAKYKAPILLTNNKTLNSNAESELKRLKVKKVFIIGGHAVVSNEIENKLLSIGINVERISGSNRYETSFEVAERIGTSNGVFLTTGLSYADALSIGPIAAKLQMPIILVNDSKVHKLELDKFIKANNITKTYTIGGEDVVPKDIESKFEVSQRIAGSNRYDTNNEILRYFKNDFNVDNAYVAVGTNFPDALSGGALASLNNNPIILTNGNKNVAGNIIEENKMENITILGGERIISKNHENDLKKFIYKENTTPIDEGVSLQKIEEYIIELTNEEREKNSLSPLKYNSTMRQYAIVKGEDMVKNDYFAHEDLKGNLMIYYIEKDGVKYSAWGENLSWNSDYNFKTSYEAAEFFVNGWMNSPGHRANILNPNFQEIGVGVVKSGNEYFGIQQFYTK